MSWLPRPSLQDAYKYKAISFVKGRYWDRGGIFQKRETLEKWRVKIAMVFGLTLHIQGLLDLYIFKRIIKNSF